MDHHSGDDEVFDVEAIIDRRVQNGVEEFLVKWKGYTTEDNTWEPRCNLVECKELLSQFERNWREQHPDVVDKPKRTQRSAKTVKAATSTTFSRSPSEEMDTTDKRTHLTPLKSDANQNTPASTSKAVRKPASSPAKSLSSNESSPSKKIRPTARLTRRSFRDRGNGSMGHPSTSSAQIQPIANATTANEGGDEDPLNDNETSSEVNSSSGVQPSAGDDDVLEAVSDHNKAAYSAARTGMHDNGFTLKKQFKRFLGVTRLDDELNFLVEFDSRVEVISLSVLRIVAKDQLLDYCIEKIRLCF